jgi:hypothetical protein
MLVTGGHVCGTRRMRPPGAASGSPPDRRVLRADDGIRTRDPRLQGSWDVFSDLRRCPDLARELSLFVRVHRGRFASLRGRSRDPDGTPHDPRPGLPVDLIALR